MAALRIRGVTPTRRIRALLELRSESVADLACLLDVEPDRLDAALENGRFAGPMKLSTVAKALEVPEETLSLGRPWPDTKPPMRMPPIVF